MTESSFIGRYQIVQLIAHGGMGSLYLARDPAIDRLIAIKVLKQGFDDEALRHRFAREARATGRLRHPNIVTVFDVGEHENQPFIAMEYVPGATLEQLIQRRAPLPLTRKLAILDALCSGLHYAHGSEIVHRDVKPANLILDIHDTLKILDFGIARAGEAGTTQAGDLVGTLNYMSPEQLTGAHVDHRADIFAVGTFAYELISYQRAFPGTVQDGVLFRILHSEPAPIENLVPGIDPALPAIVGRAMAKSPDDRYQDLDSLRQDLAVVASRLPERGSDTGAPFSGDTVAGSGTARGLQGPAPETGAAVWQATRPASSGGARPPSSGRLEVTSGSLAAEPGRPPPSAALDSAAPTIIGTAASAEARPHVLERRRGVLVALGAAAAVVLAISLLWFRGSDAPATPESRPADTGTPPAVSEGPSSTVPFAGDNVADGRRALDAQLISLRATARRQIAAGQSQQALDTVGAGFILDASDPELNKLLDELQGAAARTANRARHAATRQGATEASSPEFRDGRAREREAEALIRSGERTAAVRTLWAAAGLYDSAAKVAARSAAPPPPRAPSPPDSGGDKAEPPVKSGERAQSTSPAQTPGSLTALPGQLEPPLPPRGSPRREQPAPSAGAAPDARSADAAAIQDVLARYAAAYESLDIAAVQAVLPGLSAQQLRDIERDLSTYRSYSVEIGGVQIAARSTTAIVTCQVTRSFVPKAGVGSTRTVPTTFHLRKVGGSWVIERLE